MSVIIDSYSELNYTTFHYGYGNGGMSGQSFTGDGSALGKAAFYLKRTGLPVGNIYCEIYAHSGTFGTNSVATGEALATSVAIDVSTLSTDYAVVNFAFTGLNQIILENETYYVLVLTSDDTIYDFPNYIEVGLDSATLAHGGNRCYNAGGGWFAQDIYDICFYVYALETPPIVGTKYSLPAFSV